MLQCLKNEQCEKQGFTCEYLTEKKILIANFTLKQTFELEDPEVVTDEQERIMKGAVGLKVIIASKKRAAGTTFTATGTVLKLTTTCDADYISVEGNCIQCAMGYGVKDGACEICGVGYYSDKEGITACTMCIGGKTTVSTGSRCADKCLYPAELCTVTSNPSNALLNPPTGSKLELGTMFTVNCNSDYEVKSGTESTFSCSSSNSDSITIPTCYSKYKLKYNLHTQCLTYAITSTNCMSSFSR